jgi:uncharacterized coiled-coil protein SlyX
MKELKMSDGVTHLLAWIENRTRDLEQTRSEMQEMVNTLNELLEPVELSVLEIKFGLESLRNGLKSLEKSEVKHDNQPPTAKS